MTPIRPWSQPGMTQPAPSVTGNGWPAVVAVVELGAVRRADADVVHRDGVALLRRLAGALDQVGDDQLGRQLGRDRDLRLVEGSSAPWWTSRRSSAERRRWPRSREVSRTGWRFSSSPQAARTTPETTNRQTAVRPRSTRMGEQAIDTCSAPPGGRVNSWRLRGRRWWRAVGGRRRWWMPSAPWRRRQHDAVRDGDREGAHRRLLVVVAANAPPIQAISSTRREGRGDADDDLQRGALDGGRLGGLGLLARDASLGWPSDVHASRCPRASQAIGVPGPGARPPRSRRAATCADD